MKNATTVLIVGMVALVLGCATPEPHKLSSGVQGGEETRFQEMVLGPDPVYIDMLPAFEVYMRKRGGTLMVEANPYDETKTGIQLHLGDDGYYSFAVIDTNLGSITHAGNKLFDVSEDQNNENVLSVDTNRDGYIDKRLITGSESPRVEPVRWSTAQPHELYQAAHPEEEILLQEVKPEFLRGEVEYFHGYVFGTLRSFRNRFPANEDVQEYVKKRLQVERQSYDYHLDEVNRWEDLQKAGHTIYKYEYKQKEEGRATWGVLAIDSKGKVAERIEGWNPGGETS